METNLKQKKVLLGKKTIKDQKVEGTTIQDQMPIKTCQNNTRPRKGEKKMSDVTKDLARC